MKIDFTTNFWANESMHFILIALISGFFYWSYRDWRLIMAAVFLGIVVDIDHLFDYLAYYGSNFSFSVFFYGTYMQANNKVYVLFHGWEYLILLEWVNLLQV